MLPLSVEALVSARREATLSTLSGRPYHGSSKT